MHLFSRIVICIAVVLSTTVVAFTGIQQTYAQGVGQFACPLEEQALKKRAIFAIVNIEADTNDGNPPVYIPALSNYFCVYVDASHASYATWEELLQGQNPIIKAEWEDKDVRKQLHFGKHPQADRHIWGCTAITTLGAVTDAAECDDVEPQEARFSLVTQEAGKRVRYYFNDLELQETQLADPLDNIETPDEEEYNLYFISTVSEGGAECAALQQSACTTNTNCFWWPDQNKCVSKKDTSIDCRQLPATEALCGAAEHCAVLNSSCVSESVKNSSDLADHYAATYDEPPGYTGPLPTCAFDGSCRNVNDLIDLAIRIGKFMLGLIGSVAFVFFIYGGMMMIISMGNADRVKKGRDILVAAVIGIIIAFSAYLLIGFVLTALGVGAEFRVL